MKKTKAMVLAEVMFALFACGILIGISIYMFKATEVKISPYLYSVLENLPKANLLVADNCYREYTCELQNTLPDSNAEYCMRLSEQFGTVGDVYCSTTGDSNSTITILNSSGSKVTYGRNFTLTNGVAFYGINNGGWSNNGKRDYIDFYVKIKSLSAIGEGIFSVRVLKNGDVVPGVDMRKSDGTYYKPYDDEDYMPYRVILNAAYSKDQNFIRKKTTVDAKEAINKKTVVDEYGNETKQTITDSANLPFREKMSFREALCASSPKHLDVYYSTSETTCSSDVSLLVACDDTNTTSAIYSDKSAYCYVAPYKPRGAGIFKIFGL